MARKGGEKWRRDRKFSGFAELPEKQTPFCSSRPPSLLPFSLSLPRSLLQPARPIHPLSLPLTSSQLLLASSRQSLHPPLNTCPRLRVQGQALCLSFIGRPALMPPASMLEHILGPSGSQASHCQRRRGPS
jgi:hypothetical protein